MKTCPCGTRHNGTYGSYCEDCYVDGHVVIWRIERELRRARPISVDRYEERDGS